MFPKKGKVFPTTNGREHSALVYMQAVAAALKEDVGETHQATKIVMRWTGADERTIKNWFAGTNGPSGAHLVRLFRHSDIVLHACLRMAGRDNLIANLKLAEVREKLGELLTLMEPETSPTERET
jgi:hypothetical protein